MTDTISKSLAALLLPLAALAAGPVQFRGGPKHAGVYDSTAPALAATHWKFKTQGKVLSSPAVVDGAVYFGGSDFTLYSLQAADGALRWKFHTEGPVASSPAVAEGLVLFASSDGNFYALDARQGKLQWKFATGGEHRFTAPGIHGAVPHTEMMPDPFDIFLSSPTVAGGLVYFGGGDHNVYALDLHTGKLQWKFATGDVVHASPAVADGTLYVGSWDSYLYALNARSGVLLWKFQTGVDPETHNQVGIASSAAVAGGLVYFGCRDGHLYAVDAKTGKQRWSFDNHHGWVIASPAVRDGVVYFPTSDGLRFVALEAATGKAMFEFANRAITFSSVALAGDTAYFGTADGWLHAVDVKTGHMRSEFQTEASRRNSPQYVDGAGKLKDDALYPDSTLDGMIIGLDRMFSLGSIFSSPVVDGGVVYFGATDGYVYAVGQ